MLRDCIRLLSEGTSRTPGEKIGLVDERGEVAASFFGIPQNDLGCRTDVLDACPKAEGMRLLLRSMSPQIIAVDELGGKKDCMAVEEALHCGCRILGTMHAERVEEMGEKMYLKRWRPPGRFSLQASGRFPPTAGGCSPAAWWFSPLRAEKGLRYYKCSPAGTATEEALWRSLSSVLPPGYSDWKCCGLP